MPRVARPAPGATGLGGDDRCGSGTSRETKPRRVRIASRLFGVDRRAEQPVEPLLPQHDRAVRERPGLDDARARATPSARLAHERRGPRERGVRVAPVDASLEAMARLGVQPVPARRAPDPARLEIGALEEHAAGLRRDLALAAAHHAGEGDGTFAVADGQIVVRQGAVDAVERAQLLAAPAAAHDDRAAPHALEIERVHRVAELEHHEVGHVDDVRDRPDPERREPPAHLEAATERPSRRRRPPRRSAGSARGLRSRSKRTSSDPRRPRSPRSLCRRRRRPGTAGTAPRRGRPPRGRAHGARAHPAGWA